MRTQLQSLTAAILVAAVSTPAAYAQAMPAPDAAHEYFTDVELIDQNGRAMRLYSDLMHDRVVVINAFFTDCEGNCPVTMDNLGKIQDWLGPRLGREVRILSLTLDPTTDVPLRLQEYAGKLKARPGWHFLTGKPSNLDFALRKLGLWVENREAHSSVFLVGNVPTGLWKKANGIAPAANLVDIVDSVLRNR